MRTRPRSTLAIAAVLLASLTGCGGGSSDKPSAPMTEVAIACDQFSDTAKKIADAQAELYGGTGSTEAIDTLVGELDALKDGAPKDVKAALDEMGDAFRKAQEVMKDPTQASTAELADLGPKLSEDSQKITAYIVAKCT
jgi:anion-transporting  ArsA/GET3 family ATPase